MNVDCVTNGHAAVERIKHGKPEYDTIFMDHMMPGMDGKETASLIRSLETEYAKSIPIIALTANAIAGNERLFLDEGFQAFISKPINVHKLDSIVRQWVMKDRHSEPITESESVVNEAGDSFGQKETVTYLPGIDLDIALNLYEDDTDILILVLQIYADHIPKELDKMRKVNEENLSDYSFYVNAMISSCAGVGATDLAQRADRMREMASNGDINGVLEMNDDFIKDTETLVANIKTWLASVKKG